MTEILALLQIVALLLEKNNNLYPGDSQWLNVFWKELPARRSRQDQTRSALEHLRDFFLRLSQD